MEPVDRAVSVQAHSFSFEPGIIEVNQGDRLDLQLEAMDVTHSLYIDGYGLEVISEPGQQVHLTFVADRPGKYKFRCQAACGWLHPFMVGELVVRPNRPYWRAFSLALLAALGAIGYLRFGSQAQSGLSHVGRGSVVTRIELTRIPWVKRLLSWRPFQPVLMLATLSGFVLAILAGLLGTPVGSKNFAIVYVWIVWFALLKIVLIPVAGRLWCTICPIPAPGEWLQRRGIIAKPDVNAKPFTLAKKWPRKLDGVWLQNISLLLVTGFSPVILTLPRATGIVLLVFVMLAVFLSLIFSRRVFCRYICPVGGFVGLYSLLSPVELRVKDREVCRNHRTKDCYVGNAQGYGCPWMLKPWTLERNAHCGLCTECLKTCPQDNVAVNVRPFGSDLFVESGRSLGEAYTAFIMLASVLFYSAVFLGPWGWLKSWAGTGSLSGRAFYIGAFALASLFILPGLFLLAVMLSRALGKTRDVPLQDIFCSPGLCSRTSGVEHVDRVQFFLLVRQRLVRRGGHFRSFWVGLGPVGDPFVTLVAHADRDLASPANGRNHQRAALLHLCRLPVAPGGAQ